MKIHLLLVAILICAGCTPTKKNAASLSEPNLLGCLTSTVFPYGHNIPYDKIPETTVTMAIGFNSVGLVDRKFVGTPPPSLELPIVQFAGMMKVRPECYNRTFMIKFRVRRGVKYPEMRTWYQEPDSFTLELGEGHLGYGLATDWAPGHTPIPPP